MSTLPFADRRAAGRELGERLARELHEPVVVLGLPRGGVPVALEVALALHAPLDVIVVRKLGVPFQPELAMGAIGEDGARVLNDEVIDATQVSARDIEDVEVRERRELERRARMLRGDRTRIDVMGRTVVIVDDGIATGATARAACQVARSHGAGRVVLAVPVAPPRWEARFGDRADRCIALATPSPFWAVGQFYVDFTPTSDEAVVDCLEVAARALAAAGGSSAGKSSPPVNEEVEVSVTGGIHLRGHLRVPRAARGLVVFAHGSGSSRHSPRNRYVAEVLEQAGFATLLFDLLTSAEERDRTNVFDVELLGGRLLEVSRRARSRPDLAALPLGFFGASTGAAAALWAAATSDADVGAIVSRGGRPDLAAPRLRDVHAPTLLVVGGDDRLVLELNRQAAAALPGECEVAVVPGATHLFEEPGTLQSAADLARDWFVRHLTPTRDGGGRVRGATSSA